MESDLKKLTLNQQTLRNLTVSQNDKVKGAPQLTITCGPRCLETNCICCRGF
ncbi:MAG TPA: hypothetical protein VG759_09075 [Candidatus Angelobacter sp.]|nr:hypothetical protein [Candidatus Angelobacter sp.]